MTNNIAVGIIRVSSIGDVILATSCIQLLKSVLPNATITWLGSNPSLSLIKESYPEIRAIEFNKKININETLTQVSHLDFIIDLQRSYHSIKFCFNFRNKFNKNTYVMKKHYIDRQLEVIKSKILGRSVELKQEKPKYLQLELMVSSLYEALKKEFPKQHYPSSPPPSLPCLPLQPHWSIKPTWYRELESGIWLSIAPGASYVTKKTPTEILTHIIDHSTSTASSLISQNTTSLGLLFLGDKNDREKVNETIRSMNYRGKILNLSGELSLKDTALALSKCCALLGNDSGLCHIAEAMGIPTAVLFGATSEKFGFGPHLKDSQAFSAPLGCRPCSKHGKTPCRYNDMKCYYMLPYKSIHDFLVKKICDRVPESSFAKK